MYTSLERVKVKNLRATKYTKQRTANKFIEIKLNDLGIFDNKTIMDKHQLSLFIE